MADWGEAETAWGCAVTILGVAAAVASFGVLIRAWEWAF